VERCVIVFDATRDFIVTSANLRAELPFGARTIAGDISVGFPNTNLSGYPS
jgi:hypothetical protein